MACSSVGVNKAGQYSARDPWCLVDRAKASTARYISSYPNNKAYSERPALIRIDRSSNLGIVSPASGLVGDRGFGPALAPTLFDGLDPAETRFDSTGSAHASERRDSPEYVVGKRMPRHTPLNIVLFINDECHRKRRTALILPELFPERCHER